MNHQPPGYEYQPGGFSENRIKSNLSVFGCLIPKNSSFSTNIRPELFSSFCDVPTRFTDFRRIVPLKSRSGSVLIIRTFSRMISTFFKILNGYCLCQPYAVYRAIKQISVLGHRFCLNCIDNRDSVSLADVYRRLLIC